MSRDDAGGSSKLEPSPGTVVALFTEITADVGLGDSAGPWSDGTHTLPEITQGGIALLDYDNDGDLDLIHARVPPPDDPGAPAPNRMWEQRDGHFVDVTEASGIGDPAFGQGVVVGDADDDGDLDVYFTNYGRDSFFMNRGDGTFADVTESAGFTGERWSTAGAFCDYDRDGDLDLVVVHYVKFDADESCMDPGGRRDYCGPQIFHGEADKLYRNDGNLTFTDVSVEAGLVLPDGNERARGLGVLCVDLTQSGLPDIFVANDGESNQLWVNQGDGSFSEEGVLRGVAVSGQGHPEASMGVAVADVNGDGRLDLYMTHLLHEHNRLYLGSEGPLFFDRTAESGIGQSDAPLTGFGCALFDVEHDGDTDVFVANGGVRRELGFEESADGDFWHPYSEINLAMFNQGDGSFRDMTSDTGSFGAEREVSRALAVGDLDEDGDLDVVLSNIDNSFRVYRNDAPLPGTHWLMVRAMTGNRDAVGAEVVVNIGDRKLVGLVLPSTSYLSSNDPRVHFGLGSSERVDHIDVRWPDGRRERFVVDGVDRHVTLHAGDGSAQ